MHSNGFRCNRPITNTEGGARGDRSVLGGKPWTTSKFPSMGGNWLVKKRFDGFPPLQWPPLGIWGERSSSSLYRRFKVVHIWDASEEWIKWRGRVPFDQHHILEESPSNEQIYEESYFNSFAYGYTIIYEILSYFYTNTIQIHVPHDGNGAVHFISEVTHNFRTGYL